MRTEPVPVKISDETQKVSEVVRLTKADKTERQSVGDIVEVLPKTLHQKAKLIFPRIQNNPKIIASL